ncbi:extracellular solute-binding protein [Candidatus Riesia pediculicola]|uniref:Putrescine-binding periplasmic protein n=1 Tax=Riesia pediculicola (strain USDA) TaxID=515618 RepID=D4G8S5_RIEPU|nr:extracellular solute-binding protein [Candidatus Riesia pediculicola]ADD79472.1 spermidine/putrescine-binding periplasmic protein [Candidatus Riesia pediculicola USDA]ARC53946.1 spermidine/putrescine ABC transporter substrate-binding protein [Candidatus Riesia pediculicola]QOJ86573.1 extracellular solute-binding protein [Candidatus Riesia pediculicola]
MKKYIFCLFLIKIFFFGPFVLSKPKQETLYFYNWSEYTPSWLLNQFTKETGIKVICSTYESNESMYSKLKANFQESYDIIVPSSYFIEKMKQEGMLQKIDKTKLKHFHNLDPKWLKKSFDPENDYSIPYIWGATGIGVNKKLLSSKSNISSWSDLWKPEFKGSVLLIDDAREIFQMTLIKLGYSGNTKDSNLIRIAYEELRKLMPNVTAFNSDNPAMPFLQGEADLGMLWNGSSFVAKRMGFPIDFVWPKEGGIFWMDNLAIPSNAKNVEGAIKLIDFLLRPEIAAEVSKQIGYPTPNLGAKKLLPKSITNDKTLYPDEDVIKKGEWQKNVEKSNILYEKYFQKLKIER